MVSKFQLKFCVMDTYDVKQKTSLLYAEGERLLRHCFMVFVLLFYVICVRYSK